MQAVVSHRFRIRAGVIGGTLFTKVDTVRAGVVFPKKKRREKVALDFLPPLVYQRKSP